MRSYIKFAFLLFPAFLMAQAPESHQKTYYQAEDGNSISSSPNDQGVVLNSTETSEYANPAFFDTEGINYVRTKNAVNRNTMQGVVPAIEIMWDVYADGLPPQTNIHFEGAEKHQHNDTLFFGKGLSVSLTSEDGMSGLLNTYLSTTTSTFSPYTSPILFNNEGAQRIAYYAADRVGNVENVQEKTFIIDLTPPKTEIVIDGIQKEEIVATSTHFALTVTDKLSGIEKTYFHLNKEEPQKYTGSYINKNQLEDGEHTLYYYTTDKVGNIENENKHVFYLDKLAPILAADVLGDRFISEGKMYFSGRTKLKITAVDNKSGVKNLYYAIDSDDFADYDAPFYLPAKSGYHYVRYYAVDHMGNETYDNRTKRNFEEYKHNVQKVYVDLTGPTIDFKIEGPKFIKRDTQYISPKSRLFIAGSDKESGLQYLSYSIDGELKENNYTTPFTIKEDGKHEIEYYGYDNVNNRNKKDELFIVDANPPEIFINFSVPSFAKSADGDPIFPAYVKLYIGATDKVTGNEQLLISINNSAFKPYTGEIENFKKGQKNEVQIRAVDKVENSRTNVISFYIE